MLGNRWNPTFTKSVAWLRTCLRSILKKSKTNQPANKIKKYSFILVGTGINWDNKELVKLLTNYELIDAVELLGEQKDINIILFQIRY